MSNEHGHCPNCNTDLDGRGIWKYFNTEFQNKGDWLDRDGKYTDTRRVLSPEEAAVRADEVAKNYGATRTTGKWGRQIGLYSMEEDRTVRWKCPACDHEWKR